MNSMTIKNEFENALELLKEINHHLDLQKIKEFKKIKHRPHNLQKVLIANRGEIAKRFFLALHEEKIPSVAVVTDVDKGQSWYEFADEVVFIGDAANYANIPVIIAAANLIGANAIYSGYGFLSENANFVETISKVNEIYGYDIIFMGPSHDTMRIMGDKVSARKLAKEHDVPMFQSCEDAYKTPDVEKAIKEANKIGYPVIVKLSAGGGGKGMYPVYSDDEMEDAITSSVRIGTDLYNDPTFYMEKFIERPVHIEVQIFNGHAIGIRKCAVQRRNQKIIEESGHSFLNDYQFLSFMAAAEKIAYASNYCHGGGAGTVEFLIDDKSGKFGFMEMNTRLQVEYAVTDQSLGIDLVKWQIYNFDGRIGEIEGLDIIKYKILDRNHSIECRIYAEDPSNDYLPSPGTISDMVLPTFNGIRSDFGFVKGDRILSMYDPMIGKLIAHGSTREEALIRLERSLQELYISGVKTNIDQLIRIVRHSDFLREDYTNKLLDENPDLNFEKDDKAEGHKQDKFYNHIIFGAFAEYIKHLNEAVNKYVVLASHEGVLDTHDVETIPYKYTVEYDQDSYEVEFVQKSINKFTTFLNGICVGSILLNSFNDRLDDFLVIYHDHSKRIRLERQTGNILLKMRDRVNKINYYKMTVVPEGEEEADSAGILRSPFEGTFVSFGREGLKVGDSVSAGDPLLILSAMKMETTIEAPIDGTITYLIEDGDLAKLILAKTPDGRIIGKSLQDGEVLIKIEGVEDDTYSAEKQETESIFPVDMNNIMDVINIDNYEEVLLGNVEKYIDNLIDVFMSAVLGFVQQQRIIDRLKEILEKISPDEWTVLINKARSDKINKIILHYTNIRRLFSPIITGEGFTLAEELTSYLINWKNVEVTYSQSFESIIEDIKKTYGIPDLTLRADVREMQQKYMFLLLQMSYHFCMNNWDRIGKQFHIVASLAPESEMTIETIQRLLEHTQAESDDSSYRSIKRLIDTIFPEKKKEIYSGKFSCNGDMIEYDTNDISYEEVINKESLTKPENSLVPVKLPQLFSDTLNRKLDMLKEKYEINRLACSIDDVVVYSLKEKNKDKADSFVALGYCAYNVNDKNSVQKLLEQAAGVISAYNDIECRENNWVEIVVDSATLDFIGSNETVMDYASLRSICSPVIHYFLDGSVHRGIVNISDGDELRAVEFIQKDDHFVFDFVQDADVNSPYFKQELHDDKNQKMFDLGKWPIEYWAEECFDKGSYEEIKIDSIDNNAEGTPVGSRIYFGTIDGSKACFYMKDYRMIGGSTGDLEGRKYVAACYLAYLKGMPLYVWNDSAGANIKQGVVSLNRGAEGFMMNSLLVENDEPGKFVSFMKNFPDPAVRELVEEINKVFKISFDDIDPSVKSRVVAVGIGASAGLDVYGGSQATIQLQLDHENSYRVLTGSNVIKSVMGEDISNYDIGGAKVLGKWAGIVDAVACDKLHLITQVRLLNHLFTREPKQPVIKRLHSDASETLRSPSLVINENIISNNVDNGEFFSFKPGYYAANALIGGFAKLGGSNTMIMGTLSDQGIRTTASVIKARELLRAAKRTHSHQIVVFGKTFLHTPGSQKNVSMRSRMDLMNTLQNKKGIRVHIIGNVMGLKEYSINSSADALIFIKNEDICESDLEFANLNATFIVDSYSEAFDLSCKLFYMLDTEKTDGKVEVPSKKLNVPVDKGEPYEIIGSVIEPVFDKDSFVEFYKDMNNPGAGPNLITGLAKLDGITVGIISDQPQIKGGAADAPGTEKFRVFTNFLNENNIPLVMLSNSSGFVPGSRQERLRIQAIGAESLDANILGEIPVVSLILNQNYGGRMIQAFNKFLRPGIVYMALEDAYVAVLGASAGFDLMKGKKYRALVDENKQKEADELMTSFLKDFQNKSKACNDATNTGVLDWVIKDRNAIRENLIKGLGKAFEECKTTFGE